MNVHSAFADTTDFYPAIALAEGSHKRHEPSKSGDERRFVALARIEVLFRMFSGLSV